jgi:hypothetical protein
LGGELTSIEVEIGCLARWNLELIRFGCERGRDGPNEPTQPALIRFYGSAADADQMEQRGSDVRPIPAPIDWLFGAMVGIERRLIG